MAQHDNTEWLTYFEEHGYEHAKLIGRGMEGLMYSLGNGLVGKVWFHRSADNLQPQRAFYEELESRPLQFSVPEIVEIRLVRGRAVMVQRELVGTPLLDALEAGTVSVDAAQDVFLSILEGLARSPGGPATRALSVIDERSPLWQGQADWRDALAALMRRRVAVFGDQLRDAVVDFDIKLSCIYELIANLPTLPSRILHGDLCPENILVDSAGRLSAVLDWGFLTTEGDPAFDSSVAAGIFDMYGPKARERDEELTAKILATFGYPHELVLLYRAAYAVITANAYSSTGRDGHFAWCVAQLDRGDVSYVLLS